MQVLIGPWNNPSLSHASYYKEHLHRPLESRLPI